MKVKAIPSLKGIKKKNIVIELNLIWNIYSFHLSLDQDLNSMAERALCRVEEKLDGKHVSRSESISVKRHVEILIKEATNEKLLCRLFVGWQPYL